MTDGVPLGLADALEALNAIAANAALDAPENLAEREEALYLLAFVEDLLERQEGPEHREALQRAALERQRLEAASERLIAEMRDLLRHRRLRGRALRKRLDRYTQYRPSPQGAEHAQYEALDVLIGGVFGLDTAPSEALPRTPGMVHLEFTPTSVVLEMVDRIPWGPGDVFVDLGAGLGQVVMLVHLLTGVRARGIEYQPSYVGAARQRAAALGLGGVEFVRADAREADYSTGSVFYLFTPFGGAVLQDVLDRLRQHTAGRRVHVCAYGPSLQVLAAQRWLRPLDADPGGGRRLAIYRTA